MDMLAHVRGAAASLILAAAVVAGPATAQQYPSQDVHIVCAFPAGSGADVIVRYMAEKLRPLMGRTIIVENKPGALGNIATEYVARAKPDGHTLYIHGASGVAASMALMKNPSFDVGKAIQVIGTINRQPTMMVVHVSKPWKTVAEVTAYAKERGDKASYATTNPVGKVMGALYKEHLGLKTVEVPYRTAADTVNDFASGAIDFGFIDNVFGMAQQRAGRLRVLAVSTGERIQAASEIPTMKEGGIPISLTGYFSLMAPAGVPRPILDQLNKWNNEVVAMPETKAFLNKFASDPWINSMDDAQSFFLKDIANWKRYIEIAKIEPLG
ncbi:MAG TPA: tripartite tricarboxylate transporter substrate binding protein [Xanthobacteraceae bacterium]|nr:tripartite tricarboxylate transporter substrate binding protein [Xanthobacteraceae bacterium]